MSKWEETRLGELIEINPETLSVSKYTGEKRFVKGFFCKNTFLLKRISCFLIGFLICLRKPIDFFENRSII